MKRKPYSVQEKEELLKSWAIVKVKNSSVTYNPKFKIFALEKYYSGKSPIQIFIEANININILGREQPRYCFKRWKKAKYSLLIENRGKFSSGRTKKNIENQKELTLEKVLQENIMLKEQVAFLKKLRGWK